MFWQYIWQKNQIRSFSKAAVGTKAVSPLDKLATVWCKIKAK